MRASPEREYDESGRDESARTKAVLAAAERRGVQLGRDPWGSIDGQRHEQLGGERARSRQCGRPDHSRSFRRPVLSQCGPSQRRSRSAAFLLRAVASGHPCRWRDSLAVLPSDYPEAVVLDLVQPERAARRLWSGCRKARRDKARRQGMPTERAEQAGRGILASRGPPRSAIELTKRRAFFAGAQWHRAGHAPS